jgi:hypothetical protein
MHSFFSKLHILLEKVQVQLKSEQGPISELTGRVSGNLFPDQGFIAERALAGANFAEIRTSAAAPPNSAESSYKDARTLRLAADVLLGWPRQYPVREIRMQRRF